MQIRSNFHTNLRFSAVKQIPEKAEAKAEKELTKKLAAETYGDFYDAVGSDPREAINLTYNIEKKKPGEVCINRDCEDGCSD